MISRIYGVLSIIALAGFVFCAYFVAEHFVAPCCWPFVH